MTDKKGLRRIFYVSHERSRQVRQDIADGSEPGIRFYVMVVVSTMIASFGLITNSTAVIIGAMLVAPLMTPIFGISLALVRGDTRLFGHAVQAEVVGVVAAIGMGFLLGLVYPGLEPTSEMIARTRPQLFDLLVAVFSGFAGAYALVDEKISPALPGVAIATAIVPPLANTGLCFSLGAYSGGIGSFLLFFSNFLSILLIGSIVFWVFRMSREFDSLDKKTLARRFGLPVISFFIVTLFLSHSLYKISHERNMTQNVKQAIEEALSNLPSTSYKDSVYREEKDKIYVFANVNSARPVSPAQVTQLQQRIEDKIGKKTELVIRSTLAQTVGALDNTSQIKEMNLDGEFIQENPHPRVLKTKLADTVVRNYLIDMVGGYLQFVQLLQHDDQLVVVASIDGLFTPDADEINEIETVLRKKLDDPKLDFVVRFQKSTLYDSNGLFHFDMTGFVDLTPEQQKVVGAVNKLLRQWFDKMPDASLDSISHSLDGKELVFLVEASTVQIIKIEEVVKLESLIRSNTGVSVQLQMVSKPEVVTTSQGYVPYGELTNKVNENLKPHFKEVLSKIARDSAL